MGRQTRSGTSKRGPGRHCTACSAARQLTWRCVTATPFCTGLVYDHRPGQDEVRHQLGLKHPHQIGRLESNSHRLRQLPVPRLSSVRCAVRVSQARKDARWEERSLATPDHLRGHSASRVIVAAMRIARVAREFDTAITAQHFATLHDDHPALRAFLYRMPKGADLHVHLSGAVLSHVFADRLGRRARSFASGSPTGSSWCRPARWTSRRSPRPCAISASSTPRSTPCRCVFSCRCRDTLLGHDQFFSTFAKVSEITWRVTPELTVAGPTRYGAQSVQYAEFMLLFSTREERAALTASIRGMTDHAGDAGDAEAKRPRQAGRPEGARGGRRHRAQGRGAAQLRRRPRQASPAR